MTIATDDITGTIAGVTLGSRADRARRQKPELIAGAQAYYEATITPEHPGGLSLPERSLVAYRVATLTPQAETAAFYRARLESLGVDPDALPDDPRLAAILRHADRVTTNPRDATPEHLRELEAAGLTPFDIVALSQVIAFVSYQARLVAALLALEQAA